MKILVLGAGGIGGMVGGRLAAAGADVTFLVHEGRKKALDAQGLRIESPYYGDATVAVKACTQSEINEAYELIVLACKAYSLDSAIDAIRPAVGEGSHVLPLLNGLAHIERLNAEFGPERVMGGSIKMQVTLTADGIIRQLSDWQTVTFGEQDGQASDCAKRFESWLQKVGIEARLSPQIMHEMWMKIVHLSTVAGMTCLMRANVGEIARTPEGTALGRRFLQTNAAIASHAGYTPSESFLAPYLALFADTESKYEASMLRDLESGGRIEADHILGDMLQRCRQAGLDDTLHLAAYTNVKAFEQRRDANRL
ncbi:MAG: 2-dehydropantoate 2-reductase [Castellaniella sp.]